MTIAITDDHRALGTTASDLLLKRDARGAARALLEAPTEELPDLWSDVVDLGWLGLPPPEAPGGSGFGLEELVVVLEELGRAVTPGPFVPTVIASAFIAAAGDGALQSKLLPGLADGSRIGGVALESTVTINGGKASGSLGPVLGGGLADAVVFVSGDDAAVVERGDGVTVEMPPNLDARRRSARLVLKDAPVTVVAGGRRALVDLARVIL